MEHSVEDNNTVEKDILTLPIQITNRVEVGRLLREVEQVDDFLKQGAVRRPGTVVEIPKTSRLLDELLEVNNMNLLLVDDRIRVLGFLVAVKTKAPLLHISFSVDPTQSFVQKITIWLRKEIHPLLLLQIGLQPSIGAGCVVRGKSVFFDFSLREHFQQQRPLLLNKLHGDVHSDPNKASTQEEVHFDAHIGAQRTEPVIPVTNMHDKPDNSDVDQLTTPIEVTVPKDMDHGQRPKGSQYV